MRRRKPIKRENKRPFRSNEEITAQKVRLIDDEGEMTGVKTLAEALSIAREAGLDLVEISPQSDPPVCRVVDYGKLIFEREKKKKEAKKHQKTVQLKEIKLRPKTDIHDYNFKVRHIRDFLKEGNKVKVTVRFKGREMAFSYLGQQQIEKIIEDTKDIASVEFQPKIEGRTIFMVLKPVKGKAKATDELGPEDNAFLATHIKEKAILRAASSANAQASEKKSEGDSSKDS